MLLLILAGTPATIWLVLYGVRLLVRASRLRTATATLKAGAVLAWAATIGIYTWAVLPLLFFDDPDQSKACNEAVGAKRLAGYEPSFVPLRFGCRTGDGHTVEAIIPSYVNLSVTVLGLCAVVLTGLLLFQHKEDTK
ncbi:hypothetical protein [Actinomadura pelletieri]|uniref:hypothetical protein n=1 Tax=Actinomadura pelletieri TaxID=111805 RepID=UPI001B866D41|nr:hypothetical protein [Actinomadura pelletieri]